MGIVLAQIVHMPSLMMWIVIGAIGLLLFGKRLPEVGRSLGQGIVEFKKGLQGIKDDVATQVDRPIDQPTIAPPTSTPQILQNTPQPFRFDPYTGKPLSQEATAPAEKSPPSGGA